MLFCRLDQFFPQLKFLFLKSSLVVVVQSLSHVWLFATPRTAVCSPPFPSPSLSFTISQGLFKLMSVESVMPSDHPVLCRLLLLPSIFPSIRVFSHESALCIRWQIKLCLFSNTQYFTEEVTLNAVYCSPPMLHALPIDFLVDFHSNVNDLFSGLSGGRAPWVLTLYLFCLFLCLQHLFQDLEHNGLDRELLN